MTENTGMVLQIEGQLASQFNCFLLNSECSKLQINQMGEIKAWIQYDARQVLKNASQRIKTGLKSDLFMVVLILMTSAPNYPPTLC